jgi:hypothetical protein
MAAPHLSVASFELGEAAEEVDSPYKRLEDDAGDADPTRRSSVFAYYTRTSERWVTGHGMRSLPVCRTKSSCVPHLGLTMMRSQRVDFVSGSLTRASVRGLTPRLRTQATATGQLSEDSDGNGVLRAGQGGGRGK